jgi:hypothetical protein
MYARGRLRASQLAQFTENLAPYDPFDSLAAARGLQLLPANAHRAVRLEILAHTAVSLKVDVAAF